ncbi:MAG TPA: Hsp20/alpha crystallin family protein [Candidatus Hydrogenedentes bacterium]|nr:Hsp20/alpha crystallin family protein [Candidatus Hydrogenedentota bacterium]
MSEPELEASPDTRVSKNGVKQRALNALTFLLAVAVCGEGYLLWEMNSRVDHAMAELDRLEHDGTAADWNVITAPREPIRESSPPENMEPVSAPLGEPYSRADLFFWDPLADLDQVRHDMGILIGQMRGDSMLAPHVGGEKHRTPADQRLRVEDVGDAYVATVALPGVEETDVSVGIVRQTLTISITRRLHGESSASQSSRENRVMGQSILRMALQDVVDGEHLKSCLKDGVLTVTIPKSRVGGSN